MKKLLDGIKSVFKKLWKALSHRLWMKLLSLLLAVLLWNYVISTNTSITRAKTLAGLTGYVTGQSTLTTYGLALLGDPTDLLSDVSVRVEVAQSLFPQVSPENVQVMLDLSNVRTAGTQKVPLRATTSYGRVTQIDPESVTLTFETLDSRLLPVNVQLSGELGEGYWYNVGRVNPANVTVSGAASVVRSLSQARVYSDVTGVSESYYRAEPFVLLDGGGNEVNPGMLNRSVSSVSVTMDVYPTKWIPISVEIDEVVKGRVAEGYTITDIKVQPEGVTVAADQSLLEGITELRLEPISVEGLSQSFSARAQLAQLSDFRNVAVEQVYLSVTIAEEDVSAWVDDNSLSFVGKGENLRIDWQNDDIQVYVTGPRSAVDALKKDGIPITVDLTGLGVGTHDCPLRFPQENYPDVTFEPETSNVSVTLIEAQTEQGT